MFVFGDRLRQIAWEFSSTFPRVGNELKICLRKSEGRGTEMALESGVSQNGANLCPWVMSGVTPSCRSPRIPAPEPASAPPGLHLCRQFSLKLFRQVLSPLALPVLPQILSMKFAWECCENGRRRSGDLCVSRGFLLVHPGIGLCQQVLHLPAGGMCGQSD